MNCPSSEMQSLPQAYQSNPLSGLKVLVVEDSKDNRLLLQKFLKPLGVEVELVSNGREAVEKATGGSFDLILMDLQMPILDGYEATRELRNQGFLKPIIALTAHAMNEEREKTRLAGFDDHLTKPINRSLLMKAIEKHGRH